MGKRINEAFFMRPWAIRQEVLTVMTEIILRHINGEKLSPEEVQARIGDGNKKEADYTVSESGVARVPIYGVIAKRASMVNGISQPTGTSVEEIRKNFQAAVKDEKVKSIMLDIDSPGGSVDGVSELSDLIYSARGKKPIVAYADGMMASAAYWVGSSADKIYASKSSEVGSIGVCAVVHDWHVALHNEGVDTKIFKAGKYKAAGNPMKPMTEDESQTIQDQVDDYYGLFVDAISRNRGISLESATKLADGRTHIGRKALNVGLIDGLGDIESYIQTCNDDEAQKKPARIQSAVCNVCSTEVDAEKSIKTATGAVVCPACSDIVNRAGAAVVDTISSAKEVEMEIKEITLEVLKAQRPELVEAIKSEAVQNAGEKVKEERARCLGIITAAEQYQDVGVNDIVKSSIEKGDAIVVAESAYKSKKLESLKAAAPASPGASADTTEVAKTHLEKAKAHQKEHGGTLTAALSATADRRK